MRSLRQGISANLCALGLLSVGIVGCSGSEGDAPGGSTPGGSFSSGGSATVGGAPASGGSLQSSGGPNSGGSPATGGSGGAPGAAGMGVPSGGSPAVGGGSGGAGAGGTGAGAMSSTGGSPPSGGMGAGAGMGGSGAGGESAGTGGTSTGGTSTGGTSAGGSGGTGTEECVKGQTKGNQVAVIGESFIAASHGITRQIEMNAKAAGSLAQNERYVDNSVSGTTLAGNDQNSIPNQYKRAAQSNDIKYVLMDGGGNDCLLKSNGDAALAAAEELFKTMAADGVEKVVYFFYPDPLGMFASGNLKPCLDALRPKMKALCEGSTAPKCYWLDLRTVWEGHNEYTQDGIHPTPAGDKATGDAIWEVMKANCVAQ